MTLSGSPGLLALSLATARQRKLPYEPACHVPMHPTACCSQEPSLDSGYPVISLPKGTKTGSPALGGVPNLVKGDRRPYPLSVPDAGRG